MFMDERLSIIKMSNFPLPPQLLYILSVGPRITPKVLSWTLADSPIHKEEKRRIWTLKEKRSDGFIL